MLDRQRDTGFLLLGIGICLVLVMWRRGVVHPNVEGAARFLDALGLKFRWRTAEYVVSEL